MGKIAFIKALAFISSIISKVIATPFVLLARLFKIIFFGLCKAAKFASERRKRCAERRRQRKLRRLEAKKARKIKKKPKRDSSHFLVNYFTKHNDKIPLIFRRIFWKSYSLGNRSYWRIRTLLQKIYWFVYSVYQKLYWLTRSVYQKIYWKVRSLFEKAYWKIRISYERLYWGIKTRYQRFYWKHYYPKSRELYRNLSQNAYIDMYLIFLRGYLNKEIVKMAYVRILSVKEFVRRHRKNASLRVIEAGRTRSVCIPEYFEKSDQRIEHFLSPDIYIAEVPDAYLIGGSNVIVADNSLLNDAAYCDKEQRIDIRYSAIKKVFDGVAVISEGEYVEEITCGINLIGAASFNYYHLIVEILSRLTFVDKFEEYRHYPILVDEVVLNIPQYHAALECINRFQHSIIRVEKEKKYLVKNMVLPSPTVWMPTNVYDRNTIRTEDFLISETVLSNIRDAVGVWQEKAPWRKIFISRKNTQAVRLENELQVRELFAQNGFEIIYNEEMSFRQQVECFGQAKCIIATSGAALSNTIFCQPDTLIGCIIPSYHRFYMYSTIAYLLHLKPLFMDAEITDMTPYAAADTFVLDLEYVKRYILNLQNILQIK